MGSIKIFVFSFLLFTVGSVRSSGEFHIIHSPDALKFSGHNTLKQSLLNDVFSAASGMSVEHGSDWSGMAIRDPFNTPEAVMILYIDGISSLENKALKSHRFPLITNEYESDTYQIVGHRIRQRYPEGGNNLVDINLADDENSLNQYASIFGHLKIPKVTKKTFQYLKPDMVEEDQEFLRQLELLKEISQKVENGAITPDNILDFYFIQFPSLHALSDFHGEDSPATTEAKNLLAEGLQDLSDSFVKAYDGSVLTTVVTSDAAHTRRTVRSLLQATEEPATNDLNLAKTYSANYPVVFNIMLWFGIVFAFSLLAIVYAIMDMDPGRDSIIYRMTSNRMKKDN